jgi:hypothetical protein
MTVAHQQGSESLVHAPELVESGVHSFSWYEPLLLPALLLSQRAARKGWQRMRRVAGRPSAYQIEIEFAVQQTQQCLNPAELRRR